MKAETKNEKNELQASCEWLEQKYKRLKPLIIKRKINFSSTTMEVLSKPTLSVKCFNQKKIKQKIGKTSDYLFQCCRQNLDSIIVARK